MTNDLSTRQNIIKVKHLTRQVWFCAMEHYSRFKVHYLAHNTTMTFLLMLPSCYWSALGGFHIGHSVTRNCNATGSRGTFQMRQPLMASGTSPCQRLAHFLVAGPLEWHTILWEQQHKSQQCPPSNWDSVGLAGRCRHVIVQVYVISGLCVLPSHASVWFIC